jgi:endoglucanase
LLRDKSCERCTDFGFFSSIAQIPAALQLLMATKDKQYAGKFNELIRPALDRAPEYSIASAMLAIPYFGNHYRERLQPYVEKYKKEHDELLKQHPYGIPLGTRHWAGDAEVVSWVVTN